ncbi:MAG TPA: hypothetical protein VKE74_11870 [Gemmataceae bacterium]|nr:hypothetical protein [Gemmataceae bacterium]
MLGLAVALLTAVAGCRHPCGLTSSSGSGSSCRLIGSGKCPDACCDPATGYPIAGIPVSGPGGEIPGTLVPGGGVPVIPGPAPGSRPDELPFPQPNGLIPPAGVPFAPPTPAPGGFGPNAGVSKTGGQPVKNEK